ncbi:phosphatase PAP2 family protein [Haloarchaeobius sp. DFWS5]|uniref:phosphatase PAP2 family protein n=1 Tax=Haloarchaeobius sp. DFWS5 TaxID=3446114 RepID=UPI003EBFB530
MAFLNRGAWFTPVVRGIVPDTLAPVVGIVSHLGDPFFLVGVLVCLYWFGDRERGIRAMGIGVGALALVVVCKELLLVPRPTVGPPVPPETLPSLLRPSYQLAAESDGYAIPSGHSLGSTVVYGLLALRATSLRLRVAAGGLVGSICLARVYLGAHYLGDVVVGASLGLVFLAVTCRLLADRPPHVALWTATAIAALAVVVAPASADAVTLLGGLVGASLGWSRFSVPHDPWPMSLAVVVPVAAAGLVGVLGIGVLVVVQSSLVLVVVAAASIGFVVALPALSALSPTGASTPRRSQR